ncbi:hypothetical protein EVAR_21849_1 [Eumeta japonica]|uniref:Uncharacterized protein n=1 Tax=Eumeta variegata TaxID=151549 RepID=A0A4C1VB09_EUMVA|nr:hypothetical protein EVAR_21849_1 [Eumeta japonica]
MYFKLASDSGFARKDVEYVPSSLILNDLPVNHNIVYAYNSDPGTVSDFDSDHALDSVPASTLGFDPSPFLNFDPRPGFRCYSPSRLQFRYCYRSQIGFVIFGSKR